jgi:aminopeptidase C
MSEHHDFIQQSEPRSVYREDTVTISGAEYLSIRNDRLRDQQEIMRLRQAITRHQTQLRTRKQASVQQMDEELWKAGKENHADDL